MTQTKLKNGVLILQDLLDLQACTFLIGLYDRYSERTQSRDYNGRALLDYYTLRDRDSKSATFAYDVALRCKEQIQLRLSTPQLFVESFFLACLFSGDSHIPHADNEREEDGRWISNHTPQRDYTGLAYLNDDFTGGELLFPDLKLVFNPKAGLFVGFPSNHNFVHAVPKVLSGKRYSLPVWFTVNSANAMQI